MSSAVRPLAIVALALLAAGCPPSFDGLRIVSVAADGGAPRIDASLPGTDAGAPTGGPCGFPQLLVAVENLRVDGRGGLVLRYALAPFPSRDATRCADLAGRGSLVAQPFAVAHAPGGRVFVGGDDALQLVDPATDTLVQVLEGTAVPNRPVDAFPLAAPGGATRLVVAFLAVASSNDVRDVWTFDGATVVDRWRLNDGSFPLGLSVSSMTRSPVHPERLLAVRSDLWAAVEVDPWTRARFDMPPYVGPRDGVVLRTVAALDDGATNRVVWTGAQDGRDAAYAITDSTGAPGLGVPLPDRCPEAACDAFVHAVPDPSEYHRVVALCESNGPPRVRKVVRYATTGGACEVLVDDASVGERMRFSRLATAVGP